MTELAISSYRRSWQQKWMEESTQVGFSDHEVAIASVRAGNVIGGGDFAKYRLIPDFMRACIDGKQVEIRNPDNIRPWQHLLEPLSGYLWLAVNLLRNPEEFSKSWNFGPAEREPVSCKMMIEKTIELWEDGSYIIAPEQSEGHETSVLRVNWDNAAHRLEWAPAYTWQDALSETVTWWKVYKNNLSRNETIDMYDVCVNHIHNYENRAREQNIRWAVYRGSN
jgi:CDP-glucose 4,6-dehydratase